MLNDFPKFPSKDDGGTTQAEKKEGVDLRHPLVRSAELDLLLPAIQPLWR